MSIEKTPVFRVSGDNDTIPVSLFVLDLVSGRIVKRPSSQCKTPYVADVLLCDEMILAHTPALGCCGLSNKDSFVYMSEIKKNGKIKKSSVCSHRVELGTSHTTLIGLNPKLAETVVDTCLSRSLFKNFKVTDFKREKTILNSRFDFVGFDESNIPFVLEVKTVPLVLQRNSETISYFPDGYRKKKGAPVSPRALKHLDDLIEIATTSVTRAIMCYVLQRGDTQGFVPSDSDPIYKAKLLEAYEKGVEILIVKVEYLQNGTCLYKTSNLFKNLNVVR